MPTAVKFEFEFTGKHVVASDVLQFYVDFDDDLDVAPTERLELIQTDGKWHATSNIAGGLRGLRTFVAWGFSVDGTLKLTWTEVGSTGQPFRRTITSIKANTPAGRFVTVPA